MKNIHTKNEIHYGFHDESNTAFYIEFMKSDGIIDKPLVLSVIAAFDGSGISITITDCITGRSALFGRESESCMDDALAALAKYFAPKHFPNWEPPQILGI